jgi:Helix-turn-helix domain of resolvase
MKAARGRGVRPGPKPKLSRQQIEHARKLIEDGQRREDVADLFKVGRVTLYRALVAYALNSGRTIWLEKKLARLEVSHRAIVRHNILYVGLFSALLQLSGQPPPLPCRCLRRPPLIWHLSS